MRSAYSMPAALKALIEQVVRPGFAFSTSRLGRWPVQFWRGKSARIVITMGMPKLAYWWYYGVGGRRSPQRVILATSGFKRIRTTLIERAETLSAAEKNGVAREDVFVAGERVAFVRGGLKPTGLVVKCAVAAATGVDDVVLDPAEERVGESLEATDEVERVVVAVDEIHRVVGTLDKRAVIDSPCRASEFAAARHALHEKMIESKRAAVEGMAELTGKINRR